MKRPDKPPVRSGIIVALILGVAFAVGFAVVWHFGRFGIAGIRQDKPSTESQTLPTLAPTTLVSQLLAASATMTPTAGSTWLREADGAVVVYVPAGEFLMGSTDREMEYALELRDQYIRGCSCTKRWTDDEQPAHWVVLGAFWIDRTEVTNAQYRKCVEAGACQPPDYGGVEGYEADSQPVVGVSWQDASDYCGWVGARLPTEAEWEYAARGPQRSVYPWGDTFDPKRCNSCGEGCPREWAGVAFDGYGLTAPVGSYPAGASWCGALDMAGNVWEWTADRYGLYAAGRQVNPIGPDGGLFRVLRGGSWSNLPYFLRSTARYWTSPSRRDLDIGFRCARSQS